MPCGGVGLLEQEREQAIRHHQAVDRFRRIRGPQTEHGDLPPAPVAMFQIAGACRSSLVIGSFWPDAGLNRTKSRIRCFSGFTPVIIVVQTSGDSGG